MLIVLFGLSGTGKNYVGRIIQQHLHFSVLDGDTLLPDDMRNSVEKKIPFTQAQRDRFIEILITAVKTISGPNIVLVQALYKNSNRKRIAEAFPDCQFIQVQSDPDILTTRLQMRNKINDLDYARKISANFESPTHPALTLTNNIDNDEMGIMAQLHILLPALFTQESRLPNEETLRFTP
ncbi:MAG: hypothetical protein A3E83_00940 [Gammaproteobacteria bacterium RIFCSPHIGHO2_12_FULL_41_20]|nr:MAG: hypothetical protein A3E83_00940 [Gammaproteobacteria bacterium RIFCSPHIGHO2_12_FULL_41_20]